VSAERGLSHGLTRSRSRRRLARATKDLDILGRLDNSLENFERVVREVCVALTPLAS